MEEKYIVGDKTLPVYRAVDPDGWRLDTGGMHKPSVTYREYDNYIEVILRGDARHVLVKQYDGGKAEATLVHHTYTNPRVQEPIEDIDIHEVLSAVRKVVGRETPTPPPYKTGDYSLR